MVKYIFKMNFTHLFLNFKNTATRKCKKYYLWLSLFFYRIVLGKGFLLNEHSEAKVDVFLVYAFN